jgi:type IV pilus assembly protein PilA
MLQKLRSRAEEEKGFTLIELLVVILIIGILAAIAIPSFLNQKSKANDANAIADARTAQTAMETYSTDNNGSYLGAVVSSLTAIESTLNGANGLAVTGVAKDAYTVSVTSKDNAGTVFSINRVAGGTITHTCDQPGQGSCHAGGTW